MRLNQSLTLKISELVDRLDKIIFELDQEYSTRKHQVDMAEAEGESLQKRATEQFRSANKLREGMGFMYERMMDYRQTRDIVYQLSDKIIEERPDDPS